MAQRSIAKIWAARIVARLLIAAVVASLLWLLRSTQKEETPAIYPAGASAPLSGLDAMHEEGTKAALDDLARRPPPDPKP